MKKLLKITFTLFIALIIVLGFAMPLNPVGNWYQQFLPNMNGRTILDITFLDSMTGYSVTSISSDTSYILKTTDGGDNWVINYRASSFIFRRVQFLNSNTGYVAGQNLIKTTNAGVNWLPVNTSLFIEDIHFISTDTAWYADPNSLTGGVFFTSNGGASWLQQFSGGTEKIYMYNARIGFISNNSGTPSIRRTTNGGLNWDMNVNGQYYRDMTFTDSLTGWYSYGNSVYRTTNGGNNWVTQTLPSGGIILNIGIDEFSSLNKDTLWGVGGTVFYGAGQFRGMIYKTFNGGQDWLFQVPDTTIHIPSYRFIQFNNSKTGWAYSVGLGGIHTTTGGDPVWITAVEQINSEAPKEFKLYQNYPNPFNPVTNIKYQIPNNKTIVKIAVYDILGREVLILVNNVQDAGEYKIDFNAANYASGVYFYRIETEEPDGNKFVDSKKMVLLK